MSWREDLENYNIRQARRDHVRLVQDALGITLGPGETFDYTMGRVEYTSPPPMTNYERRQGYYNNR